MTRPPASELALTLRRIAREKADHMDRWRKHRPSHWIEMYEHDVLVLQWALKTLLNGRRKAHERFVSVHELC
jgi:hypothetical protein